MSVLSDAHLCVRVTPVALIQAINGSHLVVTQFEMKYVYIIDDSLFGRTLGEHDNTSLVEPPEYDLSGGHIVLVGHRLNQWQFYWWCHTGIWTREGQRCVRTENNALSFAELMQTHLIQVWVTFHLIGSGHCRRAFDDLFQLLRVEVGHTNRSS